MHFLRRLAAAPAPRCVVYTCLFGSLEHFNDFAYERDERIDYICFTDDPGLRSANWQVRVVSRELLDPPRASKRIKALAHRFLPEYDWSIYVDNAARIKRPPREMFDRFLAPSTSPFVSFRHPERDCVYDEAEVVIDWGLDHPDRVRAQMSFYRQIGYPAHNGLTTSTFILRRHHDPTLIPVMERWHQQVLRHSLRDQLSLAPAAWFDRFELGSIDLDFRASGLLERPVLKDNLRLPRDFDDARYKELYPDVTMDVRKHYLLHGLAEQRPYK
ncbi:MAG: hypothetical protein QOD51_1802 [Candidatus Eremiobacteraeota bacterium]|jgi:hypothetical protein|nr:hypothetical protein [Candidatus Eremiobacteraeota bacterium]